MPETRRRSVAVDANVLVNLIHLDRLDLLNSLPDYEFVVPDIVVSEITVEEQAQRLNAALDQGYLRAEPIVGAECDTYAELTEFMGRGEAACIAMAEARGWLIASDEKRRVLRTARDRLGEGRVLNTPGILLLAIRTGEMTVDEADRAKPILENHRFTMKFTSFAELAESRQAD